MVFYPLPQIALDEQAFHVYLIKNISVIDLENDTILPARNILVEGNFIRSISQNEPEVLPNRQIIDGSGKFLLPALWDMHAHLMHLSPAIAYPLFVASGVTHIRDMRGAINNRDLFASSVSLTKEWNAAVQEGKLIGPWVHSYSSFAVEGPHPMFKRSPHYFNCSNGQEAKMLIGHLKAHEFTQVKIYNNIPRQSFFALAAQAKLASLDVVGHKPYSVSAIEASNAGMKSLEHAKFLLWESFSGADQVVVTANAGKIDNTHFRKRLLAEHDTVKLGQILETLAKNRTWYCPTHLTRKADAYADNARFRKRYEQINPILRFLSFEDLDATISEDSSADGRQIYMDFYLKSSQVSYQAYRQGVKILAGSDVPELPGSSLHEELEELSLAGLPPFEVLRTATLYPAQYFNLQSQYGSIKEGKVADLIILNTNPVSDVGHTRNISAVIFNGNYIGEAQIEALISQTNKLSNGILVSAKLLWAMLLTMTI
ncbi:amidohydrolase family protein [Rhodocytophaga aerolata]|uniref:Amidohydrolase family protein n=1 Tax=Rhodocytophaga aerolata TaxID=455078 RepID=A0ABT8RGY0_9BACT|nr:amidohydrolase family protein [Rhodocytophaga aerolata]MDO1451370.1 amidohydrolase family protein [Rhodocytophaga aerolata]